MGGNGGKHMKEIITISREYAAGGRKIAKLVAEQLNITPKYFSTVCKQITGRTALDIINSELVKNARLLLLNPNNSVKQVSVRLGFANQSHFGTFMRRNAGMSPLKFRQSLLNKDNQA